MLNAFVKAGLVKSNGEARRQIAGGGLRVNDVAVADEKAKLTPGDASDGVIKLSLGRKRHVLLKPVMTSPRRRPGPSTPTATRMGPDLPHGIRRLWSMGADYSAALSAVGEGLRSSASRAVSRALATL